MGLDTTHDCWHGPYSRFQRWRIAVANAANFPPLMVMEGYYAPPDTEALTWAAPRDGGPLCNHPNGPVLFHWFERYCSSLPIGWWVLGNDPLVKLLDHSDCDGSIASADCAPIADRLEEIMPKLGEWQDETRQFIDGLRLAASRGEDVEFH